MDMALIREMHELLGTLGRFWAGSKSTSTLISPVRRSPTRTSSPSILLLMNHLVAVIEATPGSSASGGPDSRIINLWTKPRALVHLPENVPNHVEFSGGYRPRDRLAGVPERRTDVEGQIGWCMAQPTAPGAVLKFGIELSLVQGAEVPIAATGWLEAPHDVLLCPLTQVPVDEDADAPLRGSDGYASNFEKISRWVWLIAPLGRAELEHLADLRSKDAKGDVHLTLQIGVRCLRSTATVTTWRGPTRTGHDGAGEADV